MTSSRFFLDTGRLTLRPVSATDHSALHGLFVQPGVRRFVFDDTIIPPEQTSDIIRKSDESFRARGFGLWLAALKPPIPDTLSTLDLVGFGAFWYFREPPELELLYGVADTHLKQGFGREIACAVVDHGFGALGMTEIRASTDAAHHASRRLLEEIGFACVAQAVVEGLDTVFYSKRAPQPGRSDWAPHRRS